VQRCPFEPGDVVIYTPTERGLGHTTTEGPLDLVPGDTYVVAEIREGAYLRLKGIKSMASGGIYWTEFTKAKSD